MSVHNSRNEQLFPTLAPESIQELREHGKERELADGDILFQEGNRPTHFYVILSGEVRVVKNVGGDEVLLTTQRPGEFTGELSMLTDEPMIATGIALGPVRVLAVSLADFRQMVMNCSHLAPILISAMANRRQEVDGHLIQQEKLAALGKMSAGLAHELNNPAAAAKRASQALRAAIAERVSNACKFDRRFADPARDLLCGLQAQAITAQESDSKLDPMTRSDREEELGTWLDERNIQCAWDVAPTLVASGLTVQHFEDLATKVGDGLEAAVSMMELSLRLTQLSREVEQSMSRISELIKAMKEYSYMDRSAFQEIDIHDGIESTLKVFHHRTKNGVTVNREFDRSLPRVCVYAGELNQVWTNLIDNALDAMKEKGSLTIRTRREGDRVRVEFEDNGPGIPAEIQSRIFEPFFTTKKVGKGTGLGLDIARRVIVNRHGGAIRVESKPGRTLFVIDLPFQPPKEKLEKATA